MLMIRSGCGSQPEHSGILAGSMKRKPKFDLQYIVHWIIGIAVAAGALGLLLQVVRFGAIMEAGGVTRPAGF